VRHIKLEIKGRVAVITMNRPEKRNALNSEVRQELYNVLKRIDSDENIRSAMLIFRL